MNVVHIRALFELSVDEVKHLRRNLNIKFEDDVVEKNCNYKNVIAFRYFMDFVNDLPPIKLTHDLYIRNHFEEGEFNFGTYLGMYSKFFKKLVDEYVKPTGDVDIIEKFVKLLMETVNRVVKNFLEEIGDYVYGIEIPDMLEIQFHEDVIKAIIETKMDPNQENIEKAYRIVDDVIRHKVSENNIIRSMHLSKLAKADQTYQMLGPRGYVTELDSKIFSLPMTNSFLLGCGDVYELAIESRSGAKALYFSNKAIQQSEYLARQIQLATMPIERLYWTDCGSKEYLDFYVRPKEVDDRGRVIYNGDLKSLEGVWYLNEETGQEEIITKDHKHLEGKVIKIRTILTCNHRDKKGVCYKCLGEISYSIFKHQNVGHLAAVTVTQKVTQNILSTKHHTKSADTQPVKIHSVTAEYFTVRDKDKLYLQSRFKGRKNKRLLMHIPQRALFGLTLVRETQDLTKINLSKVSKVYEVLMEETAKEPIIKQLPISTKSRPAYFSQYFWSYLLKKGVEVDDNDDYVIDLTDYDFKKPIIIYEKVEYDFATLVDEFSDLIKYRKILRDKKTGLYKSEFTTDLLLNKLLDLLNKKLQINISILAVIVYALSAWDINNQDFDLARNSPNSDAVGLKHALDYRSIGGSYNWDNLQGKVFNPHLFRSEFKPDHPLDVLFKPIEVIKAFKEEERKILNLSS